MRKKQVLVNIPAAFCGMKISDWLACNGYSVSHPCGGNGSCGKCGVLDASGNLLLSCRSFVPKEGIDIYVSVDTVPEDEGEPVHPGGKIINAALDIGTTTLALAEISDDGKIRNSITLENPQKIFGADVLSRICAAENGKLGDMRVLLSAAVNKMITKLGASSVSHLYAAGNPTMLHIFRGISPESLGKYPFEPVFTSTVELSGEDLGINAEKVTLLPSSSAFIGSDVLAGACFEGLDNEAGTVLLADIGTNGELILCHKGEIYSASTAAGPALEGACISCGVGGVSGGVCRVSQSFGRFDFETVDGIEPVGICGSGLTDLIAALLKTGFIDKTGFLRGGSFTLCKNVTVTQADIRAFQLASSAVISGIYALLNEAGVKPEEISRVYVAGTLGYYLDMQNAVYTGIFPAEFSDKLVPVGNTALAGAASCIIPGNIQKIEEFALKIKNVDLNTSKIFEKELINNMNFGMFKEN